MELYGRANGESETSVEGNSETVGFSSATRKKELFEQKMSIRHRIFCSLTSCRCVLWDFRKHVRFLFPRIPTIGKKGRLIRFSRSWYNLQGFFDRSSLSFRTATPAGHGGAGLVYSDVFCGDILSYKIADIHRISIEMAADVAAAIGRRALSRPLRDASLSVGPLTRPV